MIRTPIIAFLGHVDAGKTTLQDFIRRTAIVKSEPGEITQAIGASLVPKTIIKSLCGFLLEQLKIELKVPGLLMIDTPGHAAFISLRRRGGTLADLAVLVVDVNEGLMPQTLEAIDILKKFKTPFIVAANKLDKLQGWTNCDELLLKCIESQQKDVRDRLDTLIYGLVGRFSELGFNADRYDRVDDYTKAIAIVPCSAKTGAGVSELLVMAAGLAQKFLGGKLECSENSPAKGTVIEVKREKGLGWTLDAIIYDGVLSKGDEIVVGGTTDPVLTKVKALFKPKPLSELRDSKTGFAQVDEVAAATGVKISAVGIEGVAAGMPLLAVSGGVQKTKTEVQKEISELTIKLDDAGVVAKADTLGALEALVTLLREKDVKVRKASIGEVTRKDVSDAAAGLDANPLDAVVLGFNVAPLQNAHASVKVIVGDVIYDIIEKLQAWRKNERSRLESSSLESISRPCKVLLMKGYVFRQSGPAIAGSEVLLGKLRVGSGLMKDDGVEITKVREIQLDKDNIAEAPKGKQVAVAYENVTMGRQLNEGSVLYSYITDEEYRKLKTLKQYLSEDEKDALREIASIMRKENPLWGV